MARRAKLDRENRTVTIEGTYSLHDLSKLNRWLCRAERWLVDQQTKDAGGKRWTFAREPVERYGRRDPRVAMDEPTEMVARFMSGQRRGTAVPLVQVTPRKPARCAACRTTIDAGETAWRQRDGTWAGHSKDRFCDRCVNRGEPPRPPVLRVVGGFDDR